MTPEELSFLKPYDETRDGFGDPAVLLLCYRRKARRYITEGYLPVSIRGRELTLACLPETYADPAALEKIARRYAEFRLRFVSADFKTLRRLIERAFRPALKSDAESLLARKAPHFSVKYVNADAFSSRLAGLLVLGGALLNWLGADLFFAWLYGISFALFALSVALKSVLWTVGAPLSLADEKLTRAKADRLPVPSEYYSVLTPMCREAECVPALLAALSSLDYPKALLDAVIVIEEDDTETAAALAAAGPLPAWLDVVIVPRGRPQTKPRACNYALPLLRGKYTVIFDAEDAPDPFQLNLAAATFAELSSDVAALQARLQFYNAGENFLTMCFALEYAAHFGGLLRGLQAFGWPLLLGGTGNHFRTADLLLLGGWDPHNVTEDADLALRIYTKRRRVLTLPSVIDEEAPVSAVAWVKQRTRWIKGHLQTSMLHSRYPVRTAIRTGAARYLGGHLFMTVPVLIYLLAPLLLALGVVNFAVFLRQGVPWFAFPESRLYAGLGLLAVSYVVQLGICAGEARRMRREGGPRFRLFALAAAPFYMLLHCVAAWRALIQMTYAPNLWEKTRHGVSSVAKARSPGRDQ